MAGLRSTFRPFRATGKDPQRSGAGLSRGGCVWLLRRPQCFRACCSLQQPSAQVYEVLYTFANNDGGEAREFASPRLGRADLSGTTQIGGRFGKGSIFVLRPDGADFDFSTIWEFSGSDGAYPYGALVESSDGKVLRGDLAWRSE